MSGLEKTGHLSNLLRYSLRKDWFAPETHRSLAGCLLPESSINCRSRSASCTHTFGQDLPFPDDQRRATMPQLRTLASCNRTSIGQNMSSVNISKRQFRTSNINGIWPKIEIRSKYAWLLFCEPGNERALYFWGRWYRWY